MMLQKLNLKYNEKRTTNAINFPFPLSILLGTLSFKKNFNNYRPLILIFDCVKRIILNIKKNYPPSIAMQYVLTTFINGGVFIIPLYLS